MTLAQKPLQQDEPKMPDIFGAHIPFAHFCGIEPISSEPGRTRLRVRLQDHHMNQLKIAHGGLTLTLLDVTLGTTARSIMESAVMTLDMQTQFISPGRGTLVSEGRVLKAARTVVFVEADVHDEEGRLVAKATGIFKPAGKRADAGADANVEA